MVDNNTASHAGGAGIVNHGTMTLNKSEVNGNTVAHGGGIYNNGGTVTLATTSITGNTPDNCAPSPIAGCTG